MKEIHVYLDLKNINPEISLLYTSFETREALENNSEIIHTTQTAALSTTWIRRGYKTFVHMLDGEIVEIKIGDNGPILPNVRTAQNIEKMVLANCFGFATKDYYQ